MEVCFVLGGRRVCVQIPLLVDLNHFRHPPPNNLPELELAATVLRLVELVQPLAQNSELTKQLAAASNSYIEQFQKQLPGGVELRSAQGTQG